MKPSTKLRLAVLLGLQAPFFVGFSQVANAQDEAAADTMEIEEIISTGTRARARSVEDSPAPVDVLSGDYFADQGDTDLSNLLRTIVPSYNVNTQPISDAATIVRPANLRGLAPDHTLVLINGKRRHRAAVIYWLGNGISNGAQGPDISMIPAIALKRVEVLRDGAAAQYGSDAIAGVMNFILKDDDEGGSM
jgi:iron complex outermembrane receptor protein